MDPKFIYTTLLLSAAGGLIFWLKGLPKILYEKFKQKFVYSVRVYQYDELFDMIEEWLQTNFKSKYKEVEAFVRPTREEYEGPSNRENLLNKIYYRQEDSTFFIKYKGKKILVSNKKEKLEKASSMKEAFSRHYTLTGLSAKDQITTLLNEILDLYNSKRRKNSIKVFANNKYGDWLLVNDILAKEISNIILPNCIKDEVIADISEFINREQWYKKVGIPYKRGYCFYGKPGNGKTSLSLGLAAYFRRNIYSLSINSLDSDSDLQRAFADIKPSSILLIEDIDKVYAGRESLNHNISFSALLNLLDGALYKHGLICIITTNYFEKLDSALIRSGRCDLKIEILNPTAKQINDYLQMFYEKDLQSAFNLNISMAELQEICISNKDSIDAALLRLNEIAI